MTTPPCSPFLFRLLAKNIKEKNPKNGWFSHFLFFNNHRALNQDEYVVRLAKRIKSEKSEKSLTPSLFSFSLSPLSKKYKKKRT
jgi:hypothetical protein